MARISRRGTDMNTIGDLPAVGQSAPAFTLTGTNLADITLAELKGKKVVLNIFPSIDTPTCAKSVRTFNQEASNRPGAVVLCVSADLPFAQSRFCGAEGLENVVNASTFRHPEFGSDYGVEIIDGPIRKLLARAVVVIDEQGKVTHTELVSEIANEPDYAAALAKL
ncbi:MAG: thiol peroxidase [Ectothiorhodospiraceae bacterium]|nr:thiol peroxidase [Ectothiorhodospiraceae bacterium]MCH8504566.1 thiol peroxidase [Ectothiorhodospiraceae bacterium]